MKRPYLSWVSTFTRLGFRLVKRTEKPKRQQRQAKVGRLEDRHMLAADVESFQLLVDDGNSNSDLVTSDPRLTGIVANSEFEIGTIKVQFDHHGDGFVDGSITSAGPGQAFVYDPRDTEPTLAQHNGPFTVKYRKITEDFFGNVMYTGQWETFVFTITQPSNAEVEVLMRI